MTRLQVERLDLLTFHGVNHPSHLACITGGCMEEVRLMQAKGLIGHVGFSTHAPTPLILEVGQSEQYDQHQP